MASAMRVFRKFRASDGRIKAVPASGVLAIVAALAMLMVLPVSAASGDPSGDGVQPVEVDGNPECADLVDAADYLFEHKIDSPETTSEPIQLSFDDLEGSLEIEVRDGEVFDFSFSGDFDAAAVIVKGGPNANFYDYTSTDGNVADTELHAPVNDSNGKLHSLSHISFCVGEGPNIFCDTPVTLTDKEGPIVEVTAEIFANSLHDCFDKEATFVNDGDTVTLDFEGDGSLIAAGRLDFTKVFDTPPVFESLEYDPDSDGENFVDVVWCNIREAAEDDGDQFENVLGTTELYPSLLDDDGNALEDENGDDVTACKVYEEEIATGFQFTVVYFEFEDPLFR